VNPRESPYHWADAAAAYDRLAVPMQFAEPAKELVRLVGVVPGMRVLDVGAGTGAATIPAAEAAGPDGLTVSADASAVMLQLLRQKGPHHTVAALAPGLPFRDSVFDSVLASFVITHFEDYRVALADMARVIRPGGQIGASVWGTAVNPAIQAWTSVASGFANVEELKDRFRAQIRWGDWFADPTNLQTALLEASFTNIAVARREYPFQMAVRDFLELRSATVESALLRERLGAQWNKFSRQVAETLASAFPAGIQYIRDVYIAVATKPAH